jgi:hypothetical protein
LESLLPNQKTQRAAPASCLRASRRRFLVKGILSLPMFLGKIQANKRIHWYPQSAWQCPGFFGNLL